MRAWWLAVMLLGAFAAEAKKPSKAALKLSKDADRLYKDNKYREAAETLKRANDLDPMPVFLFNIARAYDQAGDLETAVDYYHRYVGLEDTEPALLKKANLALDRLRTLIAKDEADKKIRDAERKRLEDETQAAKAKAEAETASAAAEKKKAREETAQTKAQRAAFDEQVKHSGRPSSGRKTASFVMGGVALASTAVAIGVGASALGSRGAFNTAPSLEEKHRLEADTRTKAVVADVSWAIAAASVVTAFLLYPKGPAPEVELGLVPTSGGAFASVEVHF